MAGDHVGERGRAALVGNVRHLDAGHALEQLPIEMVGRSGPARCERQLAGIVLGIGHELGHRMHRQGRRHHEDERDPAAERDRDEILDRIVRQLLVHGGADRERSAAGHHDGVAIGRGLGAGGRPDYRARTRPVLDHDGFAQSFRQRLCDRAAERVHRSARRPWRDQGDLPGGEVLRPGGQCRRRSGGKAGDNKQPETFHLCPPVCPGRSAARSSALQTRRSFLCLRRPHHAPAHDRGTLDRAEHQPLEHEADHADDGERRQHDVRV